MIGALALRQRGAPPALQELNERVHALAEVTEVEVSTGFVLSDTVSIT